LSKVVNNPNGEGFIKERAESFNIGKKMIQVHMAIASKYKQRTD